MAPAASIVMATAYVARNETQILDAPADGKPVIATLRKGQRVLAAGAANGGWTPITLDDGTVGYVSLAALRQVQPNASEKLIAASMNPVPQASAATAAVASATP